MSPTDAHNSNNNSNNSNGIGSTDDVTSAVQSQMSDEELERLLEMTSGRDATLYKNCYTKTVQQTTDLNTNSNIINNNGSMATTTDGNDDEDDLFDKAQRALKARMELLKEVDLRQLGDTLYAAKKAKSKAEIDASETSLDLQTGKRVRKERIVMVDGKGSGYGGMVPVFADSIEADPSCTSDAMIEVVEQPPSSNRGRPWSHRLFCTMCGKRRPPSVVAADEHDHNHKKKKKKKSKVQQVLYSEEALDQLCTDTSIKCAHCPWIIHSECAEAFDIFVKTTGMFICPHHRCALCTRSTASAGGMLFRCTGCLTSYCEDCLPPDEIDSVGRCRGLEGLGYNSKQAYYIKCPSCCIVDGSKPSGIAGEETTADPRKKKSSTAEVEGVATAQLVVAADNGNDDLEDSDSVDLEGMKEEVTTGEEEEEVLVPIKTQLMRIVWDEVVEPFIMEGNKHNTSLLQDTYDEEQEQQLEFSSSLKKRKRAEVPEIDYQVDVPDECSLSQGVDVVMMHQLVKEAAALKGRGSDLEEVFANVRRKVSSGKPSHNITYLCILDDQSIIIHSFRIVLYYILLYK